MNEVQMPVPVTLTILVEMLKCYHLYWNCWTFFILLEQCVYHYSEKQIP